MTNAANTKRSGNSFIWISLLMLGGIWFGTEQIEVQLKGLKVHELKQFQSQPFDGQAESFVQGWARGSKPGGQSADGTADLDEVFLKRKSPRQIWKCLQL
jgi:hypothetical protein